MSPRSRRSDWPTAWRSVVPGSNPAPIAERNLDSASLAASLLNVAGDLYEPSGHLYGRARTTGAPIVLDRFARPSHNAIVLGQTGTGKTMATGAEIVRCIIQGIRVLAVDPLGDYRRLTAELGGLYIEPGSGETGLNPLALTGERTAGALTAKLQILVSLVAAMVGSLSRDERPVLDIALRRVYELVGITTDPATHDEQPPTLAGLLEVLRATPGGGSIATRLERWAVGSLALVFAGRAPSLRDRQLVVVGLASLTDPEVRSVAQLAALAMLWDAVRIDLARKLVVVDEAWKVMRQPAGAAFIEELARSARHYHAGLQLATQDIVEFLRSDFGEPIVKQCDIRILLGQTPEGADALARYFDLTPAERRSLIHARPGEGLLFVGRSHVAYEAVVSRREYAALTTPAVGSTRAEASTPAQRRRLLMGWLRYGCAIGCAGQLVAFIILCGAIGILAGSCAVAAVPVPAPAPIAGIPPAYLVLYEQAGERFGLQWQVLAGVGQIETHHGRGDADCAPNFAGARGPMQFLPGTFAEAARLAGIANPNICNPADAIPAAAALLRADGAPENWTAALLHYNPNPKYPDEVMYWANRYAVSVQVVWPLDGQDHPVVRADLAHARAAARLPGQVLRPLPPGHRHRRTPRHASPGDIAAARSSSPGEIRAVPSSSRSSTSRTSSRSTAISRTRPR